MGNPQINELINNINRNIITPIVILLFAVALLMFIWGVYDLYIAKGGDADRQNGSRHILAGVIGMVIMLGVFSIMHFALNTVNVFLDSNVQAPPTIPNQ